MTMDWDDLRFFLAVIEHGSTKRAAAALRIDQTTCARRIRALEASLGLELFTRHSGRYVPTAEAMELVASAKAMRAAADQVRQRADQGRGDKTGTLRVTTEESLANAIVLPAVSRFMNLHPDLHLQMDISTDMRDLEAGEADVAVRGGMEPTQASLVRRKLADDPFGFYCARTYQNPPASAADLPGHPIACFDVLVERLRAAGLGECVKHVNNSASGVRAIVESGNAIAPLPRSVAEADPPLRLCFTLPQPTAIWVIYPERLRRSALLRKFVPILAAEAERWTRTLPAAPVELPNETK